MFGDLGLEATLSDSKKKYGDKVNALLSAWTQVTNYIPTASPEDTQNLIEWVHKHTLDLVLRGEWPKLTQATKTHLGVTLQRCANHLAQHPAAAICTSLISFVHNPWSNPVLVKIISRTSDEDKNCDVEDEEEFCCSEKGELLVMRLRILCEERCEDIAIHLAAACVRTLRRSERLQALSDTQHVQYMIDLYIVILYKLKRTKDILAQLKLMDFNDGLGILQRLSGEKPTKYRTARIWRLSPRAAEVVAQYLATAGMVGSISDIGGNVLEEIFNSWAKLYSKNSIQSTLPEMIRKLIEPAESAQHIYLFCAVLLKHFGDSIKPVVIESYIRALTTDMNEMENQKAKSDKEHEREIAKRLSTQFLKLADVVESSIDIAKECVLTAFSLHPTRACYDRIREIAVACGKMKENGCTTDVTVDDRLSSSLGDAKIDAGRADGSSKTPNDKVKTVKNVDCRDKLLKSLLSSPSKKDPPSSCPLHPRSNSTTQGSVGTLCFNCGEFTGIDNTKKPVEKSESKVSRSLNSTTNSTVSEMYEEKSHAPGQVLDGVKLGLSRQLCDDLQVVLNSPRYHNLNWALDWTELNTLCDTYLHHAEEIRNTNKELKYLNIDYNLFKNWPSPQPSDEENAIGVYGIEKGYEPWVDVPSDNSERFGSSQPAAAYKRTTPRRSLEDSSDSDSGSLLQVRRTARQRKLNRLESSESDYDSGDRKPKHFRVNSGSVSDTEDTNTQDSQTDSLGSDGCRQEKKTNKSCNKDMTKERGKSKHFRMLVNENIRRINDDVTGSDVSNEHITLFAADMDENKRETIKGSAYPSAPLRILTEKRSDPAVLKSLRMFRHQNTKVVQKNILNNKTKDNVANNNSNSVAKFAPMLSTLNLNPKIVLTRADEIDRKLLQSKKPTLSTGDLTSELMNIQKKMTFSPHKNSINSFHKRKSDPNNKNKNRKNRKSINSSLGNDYGLLAKAVRDSDINTRLAKNVPGLNSLDMMVPPRVQSTVNVVQLSRNIPQSPNSGSINSGNTPPRNRTSSIAGNIQLPGTPSSGGHDSGVGMSPAGQTPPPRSSALHDVGEEANQPPDTSSPGSTNPSTEPDSPRTQRMNQNDSPNKSPSPSSAAGTVPTSEQIQLVYKQDGMYQLASVNPNVVTNQRSVLTLQNLEEGSTVRHVQRLQESTTRNTYERSGVKVQQQQPGQNTGLPKFQHAFGKTIYTLSAETSTTAASSTTDTITQPLSLQKTSTNLSKAVQTSVPSTQANINVQSITNIPNLQLTTGRPILNIVQSGSGSAGVTTPTATQTITQLVQNASPGVIYAQKIPTNVTISTTNPGQLNLIPTISHTNSLPGGRAGVVKLNIIRTPLRQQNIAIQAALTGSRIQTNQQRTPATPQPQQAVRTDSLLNEVANPVSSTTLEQLREFESVLEQVKERSTIQPQQHQNSTTTTTTVQTQTTTQQTVAKQHDQQTSVSALAQQLLISTQSSSSSEFSSNGNAVSFQQDVFPQKVSLATITQSNVTTTQKVTNSTPVVVFTSYCQPAASPALSVTSQSSSSPCVTPAPASVPSAGKTPPTPSPKSGKKTVPKTVKTSATNTSKASPIPKPQQKPQEDEQTAQRIYTILAEYAEQLRNSPDLNNKPAPRRRSNPPTNPSQSSKRKKSSGKSKLSGQQSSEMSPSAEDLGRTMGSEDSSSGVVQIQDSPAGFTSQDEAATPAASVDSAPESTRNITNDSNDGVEVNVKRRNLFFTESGSGQPRAVIVQETVPAASVSVSEALASVTGKVTGTTAVFVSGTNYVLPMNLMKGTQQFHIVSGGSKLLTVPGVRTAGTTGVSNALVLQSFLNQASKIISQPGQVKQVKMPTLQTLTTSQALNTQSGQNTSVIIPQTGTSGFTNDSNEITIKTEAPEIVPKSESTTPVSESTSTILVNKSPSIGLIQRNLSDITDGQQICGVITSNPNLTLQGTRIFNSSIAKLSSGLKTESVVCLAQASGTSQQSEKKLQETTGDKSVQMHGTIALAFATQSEVPVMNNNQSQQVNQKETKEVSTEIASGDKVISPKSVKRKIEETLDIDEKPPPTLIPGNSISSGLITTLQSSIKVEPASVTTSVAKIEDSGEYSVAEEAGRSEDQQSPLRQTNETLETTIKVENGVLCGNARLQEAWEPERKPSPDTPWRFVPTSTNQLNIEPLKVYSRDGENSENVQNVLQIINKGQGIEMASGQVFQTNAKKYYMNHTLEPFQQYAKGTIVKNQSNNPRVDREMQRLDRNRAALERELRLQKSLSEECEDLGVDEPSTSDLFPEADLFFDTNHSPSFDHSSQDASCSQPLGVKFNATYFRPLDSSSGSRDASPVDVKVNERRKTPGQRGRAIREALKRTKRDRPEENSLENPAKHMRLSPENLSQDDGSSTSDVSRMSPGHAASMENVNQQKIISRNGSKEGSPSSASMSIPSNMKLDMDLDSESLPLTTNNATASSGEESLPLLSTNTTDVTIPSPLSPIAGPLLSTHKYTYANKKRAKSKVLTAEYLSWESPISERTRSSSDDEDSSISESISSQNDDSVITNGMDDNLQGVKTDHCTYLKKDKLVNARVVLNRADTKAILAKRAKEVINEAVVTSDKTSEASDDDTCHATLIEPDCRARRSSLRGHVKKGCPCCNGSPERPKKKSVKVDHKLKKKLISKQIGKKR
ncbi:mucin-5AC [Diachasma alloeum]|uniref:mucin-5AC n=1 Tax=Diachasma alloeum TaxID=454923 RepID=UPI0007383639|nr:mucin-5AC [Diachasma alloeum]